MESLLLNEKKNPEAMAFNLIATASNLLAKEWKQLVVLVASWSWDEHHLGAHSLLSLSNRCRIGSFFRWRKRGHVDHADRVGCSVGHPFSQVANDWRSYDMLRFLESSRVHSATEKQNTHQSQQITMAITVMAALSDHLKRPP